MEEQIAQLQTCMYQYSRAIYRSIKDLIDPYAARETQLEYRRLVLVECERTMMRLADDPHYFAKPDRALRDWRHGQRWRRSSLAKRSSCASPSRPPPPTATAEPWRTFI